jgi:hypothetical protein
MGKSRDQGGISPSLAQLNPALKDCVMHCYAALQRDTKFSKSIPALFGMTEECA